MALPRLALVIPAFREVAYLEKCLESLQQSYVASQIPAENLGLVIVVNHPREATMEDREESFFLLSKLQKAQKDFPFPLTILDETDPGLIHGVGEARKIGMDYAVKSLFSSPQDRIVSLDADVTVSEDYLSELTHHAFHGAAFTLRFQHKLEEAENRENIAMYELFLRYMKNQLARIGSPYAFYTIGSCLGTDVKHYRMSGGMVAKSATEDFHFLNKLRKLGPIEEWDESSVYPSPRRSTRVLLGTGFYLEQANQDHQEAWQKLLIPSPAAFDQLATVLKALDLYFEQWDQTLEILKGNRVVNSFFDTHKLYKKIETIRKNCTTPESFNKRIIHAFDGLMTWRLLRALREKEPTPTQETFLQWCNTLTGTTFDSSIDILKALRKFEQVT